MNASELSLGAAFVSVPGPCREAINCPLVACLARLHHVQWERLARLGLLQPGEPLLTTVQFVSVISLVCETKLISNSMRKRDFWKDGAGWDAFAKLALSSWLASRGHHLTTGRHWSSLVYRFRS